MKWRIQIFKTRLSEINARENRRRRIRKQIEELRNSFDSISEQSHTPGEFDYTFDQIIADAQENTHAQEDGNAKENARANLDRMLQDLEDRVVGDEADCSNPLNFPHWHGNADADRPQRPLLRFSISYPASSTKFMMDAKDDF